VEPDLPVIFARLRNSSQSHWVSSPGLCGITAFGRSVAVRHASQTGRRFRVPSNVGFARIGDNFS
jgi:hypothetical protein